MEKPRKKILITITKSVWGGAQRYVYDLATHLPKDRYEVVVALGGNGPLKKHLETSGIRVITIEEWQRDIAVALDVKSFLHLLRILRTERPDIVHANSSKAGGVTALAGRIVGIPKIIFTAHGWPFNDPVGIFSRTIRWFFSWITALLSHEVIVVSKNNLHQGFRMPGAKHKMRMIHNGIPPTHLPDETKARQFLFDELHISHTEIDRIFFVGAIGEMNRNKSLETAIGALAIARVKSPHVDMRLCIIGDGEERKKLTDLVRTLRLQNAVYMPGAVRGLVENLTAFDAFIMPSRKEGLPYVILEAGQAGLPVVASSVGGIPEIIEDKKTGILTHPQNVEAFAQAFCFFVKDQDKAHSMGDALRKNVAENFSLKKMLADTERLYGN